MSDAPQTIARTDPGRGALASLVTVLRDSIATLTRYQFDAPWRHDVSAKR
jgi:hypothetical protein